jgi:hypothetical protein
MKTPISYYDLYDGDWVNCMVLSCKLFMVTTNGDIDISSDTSYNINLD